MHKIVKSMQTNYQKLQHNKLSKMVIIEDFLICAGPYTNFAKNQENVAHTNICDICKLCFGAPLTTLDNFTLSRGN